MTAFDGFSVKPGKIPLGEMSGTSKNREIRRYLKRSRNENEGKLLSKVEN
jgi:hypothetical protein